MALEIFKLFGSILVNNEDANKSIGKTDEKAESLGNKFVKGVGTAAKWGAGIVGAASAGAAALIGVTTKSAETMDVIDKMSAKIGISKQGFQEWSYVMGQNGMDVSKLQVGMKTLLGQMDGAANGTKSAQDNFKKLGLTWSDSTGKLKSQEQMLKETMYALADMENGSEKAKLATELFGKAGSEMMPMLNGGSEGMKELTDRAHELGLVVSDDAVTAGVVLGDTLDDVKQSFGAVMTKIGNGLMPVVQMGLDWILDHMPEIQDVVGGVFSFIQDIVSIVITLLKGGISLFDDVFGVIIDKIFEMKDTFNSSMEEFDDFGEAFKQMLEVITGPLDSSPIFEEIGKIISGIKEVKSRIADGEGIGEAFKNAFEWRESSVYESLMDLVDFCTTIFDSIKQVIQIAIDNSRPILEGLGTVFSVVLDYLKTVWENVGRPVFEVIEFVVKKVVEVFSVAFPIVADIFQGLCDSINLLWNTILKPVFDAIGWLIENILKPVFITVFSEIVEVVKSAFSFIGGLWTNSLKPILDGIILFIGGIFTGNWSQVWEGIKSILSGLWSGLKSILWSPIEWFLDLLSPLWEKITWPFRKAAEAIGNIWSSIKSVFKLPHFTLDGTLNPLKWIDEGMPKIGVDWYYKGGIFNEPTVLAGGVGVGDRFNGNGGNPEVVAPLDELYEKIRNIVRDEVKDKLVQLIINSPKALDPSETKRQVINGLREMGFLF